jgi:transcriptional regulator with XRE-family HTH domain
VTHEINTKKTKELGFLPPRIRYFKLIDYVCQNNNCLMKSFGEIIKQARETKGLYLRQVAAVLDIDQAIISKFEHGDRKPSKEQVMLFAEFFKLDKEALLIAWLSDKVAYDLKDEVFADKVLKVAEQKILYKKYKTKWK